MVDLNGIKEHIRLFHNLNEDRDCKTCYLCMAKFKSSIDLRSHMKTMFEAPVVEGEEVDLTLDISD